jgi:type I restriction enzyme, S subunit
MTLPEFCAPTPNSIRRGPFGSAIKKEFFVPAGYKVYEQQNAIYDDCELGSYFIDEQKFKELKSFEVGPGDIIISCSGTIGRIAILPEWAKKGVINQALLKLSLNHRVILPHYFLFLFRQKVDELIAGNVRGSAMVNITGVKDLKKILWPIPPLDEQREIVGEIEKQFTRLEAGVAGLRRVQANLKRYRAAVLKAGCEGKLVPTEAELARQRKADKVAAASRRYSSEENQSRDDSTTQEGPGYETGAQLLERILHERRKIFERAHLSDSRKRKYNEPTPPNIITDEDLPEGWTWASWEQIALSQNGRPFPSAQYTEKGFKLLRPGNLHISGKVVWTEENTRYMPQRFADENLDLIVRGRELVMNLTAQSLKDEFLGRVCVTNEGDECLLNQRLARLTPVIVPAQFALYLLKAWRFRRFVDGLNSGSLIQHMFTSQLAEFAFPLPPVAEQQRIIAEVERRLSVVEELEAVVNANLQRGARLRQSILERAFKGTLLRTEKDERALKGESLPLAADLD